MAIVVLDRLPWFDRLGLMLKSRRAIHQVLNQCIAVELGLLAQDAKSM
jgi:hypothetical protein